MTRSKSSIKVVYSLLVKAYWKTDTEVSSQSTVSSDTSGQNKQQATFKVAVKNLDKLAAEVIWILRCMSRWLFIHFK